MATVKVKFRSSIDPKKEGIIYYQVIHNRKVCQIKTNYSLFSHEWNEKECKLLIVEGNRQNYLQIIGNSIYCDIKRFKSIIMNFENNKAKYTTDDILFVFRKLSNEQSLFKFMSNIIEQLRHIGKQRSYEIYSITLRSFMKFRENMDIPLENIDSDTMLMYEVYLQKRGLTMNTSSFYMRVLRAVYNRAVEKDLIINRNPFKYVYTGIGKTVKRAIQLKTIKQIKNLDLSLHSSLELSRDMFLFSFYTRGMSFIDMAYLKKRDLFNGILSYRRRKTGQQLFIRWEKCMQEIVDKYYNRQSEYLLPIIKSMNGDERRQYQNAMYLINRKLKTIGEMVGLQQSLTMYVARHSWASIAKSKNIPISVISEGMGHDSEKTTQIYLASLDTSAVDKANGLILKGL